jgi:hypothetical protein
MPTINIQLPAIQADKEVEIEIKINGSSKRYHYRVEIIPWEDCPDPNEKIQCLRQSIEKFSPNWQLVQIGTATDRNIPLTFRATELGQA